jgi:hypothetical protein
MDHGFVVNLLPAFRAGAVDNNPSVSPSLHQKLQIDHLLHVDYCRLGYQCELDLELRLPNAELDCRTRVKHADVRAAATRG